MKEAQSSLQSSGDKAAGTAFKLGPPRQLHPMGESAAYMLYPPLALCAVAKHLVNIS